MVFLKTAAIPYRDYVPPYLSKGKEWIVIYYVKNPYTSKLKRIRVKLNHIPTRERNSAAKKMMADISAKLALGWNPITEAAAPKSYALLSDALDSFLKIKSKECESDTTRVYSSYVKIFRTWLESAGFTSETYACSVTNEVAMEFMNAVDVNEKISARTYNNYLKFYQLLFNWMKGKGFVSENPFEKITCKPRRLTKKTRRLLSDEELNTLIIYLRKENPHYLLAAMLCYCCFIRPKELALLKCSDIDIEKQLVHIRPEIAKNDRDSFRTIPDDLISLVRNADLSHPDWYLFADHDKYDFSPGKDKVCSRKIAKYWSDHLRQACNFGMDLQFYSLKDTGITNMLGDGVPINLVQQQADHSSVAMTAVYVGHQAKATNILKTTGILNLKNNGKISIIFLQIIEKCLSLYCQTNQTMKSNELHKLIRQQGWVAKRQCGSHVIYEKAGVHYTVPNHGSKEMNKGLVLKIKKEMGLA